MYKLFTANKKTKKRLRILTKRRSAIKDMLDRLKINPRRELGAHPLHGRLSGKWACWLGSNIRAVYKIDNINNKITIEAIGSHKIY